MSRRIVTTQLNAAGEGAGVDKYSDKVVKNIPADVVAAWLAVTSLIASASGNSVPTATILWIAFGVGVIFTALYTLRQTALPGIAPAVTQTLISTGSFIVWVFALGGPFATMSFWQPLYGSLLLIFYTLAVGLINPPEK